jgi:hypothetical protein
MAFDLAFKAKTLNTIILSTKNGTYDRHQRFSKMMGKQLQLQKSSISSD